MKKKSTSQSAFFNLRVLIGLFVFLAGVFLALLGFGTFSAQAQQYNVTTTSIDPLVPAGFDCSRIQELGIDKQENMRAGAIMIYCGEAEGGAASPSHSFSRLVQTLLTPLAYGTTDVDLVTGGEISPNVTQSETFTASNPDNLNQIVVAYNDSRGRNVSPINISGASVSTDGGNTFTRLTNGSGQSPFSNTVGDPVILYNRPTGTWYTVWLDGGCADTSPLPLRTRIAGPIIAFTPTTTMTESLAGRTTIHPRPSTDGCTFPGTTSMSGEGPFSSATPLTTASLGRTRDRSPAARRLSATSRSRAI